MIRRTSKGVLTLEGNGRYTATIDVSDRAMCVTSPCEIPEAGRWTASGRGPAKRLRLVPDGGSATSYEAQKTETGDLTLSRESHAQTLRTLGAGACLEDTDCGANESCPPALCLMYCAAGDPYCCGPRTCQGTSDETTCCDPATKPPGGLEGVWCCGDGSWQHDIGSRDQAASCGALGVGEICGGSNPTPCGGFANLPCPEGYQCVDDPSDSCDPSSSGADCGGICLAH